jgi:hypothetical protein
MQFARLKSSQPLEGLRSPVIDRPTVAHHYQRPDRWLDNARILA